jgi:hypothetical protein
VTFDRVVVAGSKCEAVLQDEGGDAEVVEPLRDLSALDIVHQLAVAAARTDDGGRPRGLLAGREVDRDRGVVDVGDLVVAARLPAV